MPSPATVVVVQPLPGIGDMIWHLPHIRALAAAAGRPVTLVAKLRSHADQIFAAEPSVGRILWLSGSTSGRGGMWRRFSDFWRLAAALRAGRFDASVVLHQSVTLAAILALAGISRRFGYGTGRQRLWLNRSPFLPRALATGHPYDQATAWLQAAGLQAAEAEPVLPIVPAAAAAVRARLGTAVGALVAVGIGSSEPYKQWGAANFSELIRGLGEVGWQPILVGGPAEAALACEIVALSGSPTPLLAIGWPLGELAALLARSACYVGNDTGAANLAAAVGTTTYCLFGGTPALHHSARIVPIVPPDGIAKADGMARITPASVMARIAAGL